MDMSKRLAVQAVTLLTHLFSNPNTTAHTMRGAERFDNPNVGNRTNDMHRSATTTQGSTHQSGMTGQTTAHTASSNYTHPNYASSSASGHAMNTQTTQNTSRSTTGNTANPNQQGSTANPNPSGRTGQYTPSGSTGAYNPSQSTAQAAAQRGQTPHQPGTSSVGDKHSSGMHSTAGTSFIASSAGMMLAENILSWVKTRLTSEDDRRALLELQQEPDSHINQSALIGRLDDYLEKHPQSMTELDGMISKSGISQSELAEAAKDIGGGLMANIGAGIKNMFA